MPDNSSGKASISNVPPLEYDGRILLLAWLDAGWTRPHTGGGHRDQFSSAEELFKKACDSRRADAIDHYRRWKEVSAQPVSNKSYPNDLLIPTTWLPFGHADLLGITLVDSHDLAQGIVADYHRTVEEVAIAHTLAVDSLKTLAGELGQSLVSASELFKPSHQDKFPLLMFTRLKMEGLLSIVAPLASQRALNAAIIRKFATSYQAMSDWRKFTGFNPDDLKFTILDLQCEEEIGILFLTRNYSFPTALINEAQHLTLGNIFSECGILRNEFERQFKVEAGHDNLTLLVPEIGSIPEGEFITKIADNHALRWLRSSMAYSGETFHQIIEQLRIASGQTVSPLPDPNHIHGWISPASLLNIPPGHSTPADNLLNKSMERIYKNRGSEDRTAAMQKDLPAKFRIASIGSFDMIVTPSAISQGKRLHDNDRLIRTSDFIHIFANIVFEMDAERDSSSKHGRNLSGYNTYLGIPVPSTEHSLPERHDPILFEALRRIGSTLFPETDSKQSSDSKRPHEKAELPPVFCLQKLRNSLRGHMSVLLRRSVEHLVENLGIILSHPLRFDIVLDYYDILECIYRTLTEHLPETIKREKTSESENLNSDDKEAAPAGQAMRRFDERVETSLASLIDAISASLELRLRHSYPEAPIRDWSLDSRTNLTQAIITADAVAKFAVGILRRNILGITSGFHGLIGISTTICFDNQILLNTLEIGVGLKVKLAYFEADTSHLTHLPSLADYWHEVFHLIYDTINDSGIPFNSNKFYPIAESLQEILLPHFNRVGNGTVGELMDDADVRESEVFVNLLMLIFIFDGDEKMMMRQAICAFARSPRSASIPEEFQQEDDSLPPDIALIPWSDALLPPLIVASAIRPLKSLNPSVDISGMNGLIALGWDALPSAAQAMKTVKQVLLELDALLPPHVRNKLPAFTLSRNFKRTWVSARHFLKAWIPAIQEIRNNHLNHVEAQCKDSSDHKISYIDMITAIRSTIKKQMAENSPWPTHSLLDRIDRCKTPLKLNGALTVAHILNRAIDAWTPDPAKIGNSEIYIKRKVDEEGKAQFETESTVADIMIESTNISEIINDPELRQRRCGQQASLMKTLWDCCGPIRQSRFISLLQAEHLYRTGKI